MTMPETATTGKALSEEVVMGNSCDDKLWTPESVANRFSDAARTARRLPRGSTQGYARFWPVGVQQSVVSELDREKLYRLPPPSPQDVQHMLEAMQWIQVLEIDERHLVWMRAEHHEWREICKRLACDRSTAWRRWKRDMQVLADKLNAGVR